MPEIEAYDPGLATGVAYGHYNDTKPFRLLDVQILTPEQTEDWIWDWAPTKMLRIYEGFRLRSGNKFTADLTGVELIGQMKLVARKRNVPLICQMPTDKALVSDAVLKSGGLWQTGKDVGHTDGRDANDAISHILAYLKKQRHIPTLRQYWGE